MNVTKGLEYIAQNEDYDYVVNVEGDNMFFFLTWSAFDKRDNN